MAKKTQTRRTHSSLDSLPRDVKLTIDRMLIDGDWPDDHSGKSLGLAEGGKPTYANVVEYLGRVGYKFSHSAVGRYAKPLVFFARYRESAAFAADIMSEAKSNAQGQTQKAVAEMATAMLIDALASGDKLSPKEMSLICSAVKDCTQVAIKADQYKQQQFEAKTKALAESVEKTYKKEIAPETMKLIREQIYGIIDIDVKE